VPCIKKARGVNRGGVDGLNVDYVVGWSLGGAAATIYQAVVDPKVCMHCVLRVLNYTYLDWYRLYSPCTTFDFPVITAVYVYTTVALQTNHTPSSHIPPTPHSTVRVHVSV
jgi:hypothetical protein